MATLPGSGEQGAHHEEFSPRSSFLEHVKYDRQSNSLDITFKSGSIHRYLFCFPATFETFRQAPDHSSFYSRAIRGKLMAVPIQKRTIGREKSQALKAHAPRRTLDSGIKRTAGTVARTGL